MRRAALSLVALLAGCSLGEDGASIERSELGRIVLQPGDLSEVFVRFDEGRQVSTDSPGGRRADRTRFDRIEGWKARYHRPGTPQTVGPIVIESRADLFDSTDGAGDDLDAARADIAESTSGWKPIDEPGLGDKSFAATSVGGGVRYYVVFWRHDNATATLNVNGFDRKLALAEVLALARKQDDRIAHAAGS